MQSSKSLVVISAEHAERILSLRRRYGHETSSHAFHTLYIWRYISGDVLYLTDDVYSLRYTAKGSNTWLFPCGSDDAVRAFIASHLDEEDFALCYLRQQDVRLLETSFPGRFDIRPSAGDSEYVVDINGHRTLAGKVYDRHRKEIRRAEREHKVETQPLTPDNMPAALEILNAWHRDHQAQGSLHVRGDEADAAPLFQQKELGITGILLFADGKPYGVAAAYPLTNDTYDFFLCKSAWNDPALGYYLRRALMCALPDNARYMNLEDDLGLPGLRYMKECMIPVRKNEMWTAVRT